MELREMTQSEQKYTYRQSHQLDAQTGCIGYLRGDFGSTGKEFYSSWFDNMAYLKTPEFKAHHSAKSDHHLCRHCLGGTSPVTG